MSEIFIKLIIDEKICISGKGCVTCIKACPVGIFKQGEDESRVIVNEANEDECTLCDLCLTKCPVQAITLQKLY